jgi:CIC family chloride channel protein
VSHSFLGNNPAFPVPEAYDALTREVLVFYPLLGVVSGLAAALFVRMFFGTEARIRRLRLPGWVAPWLGGAAVGGLVLLSGGLLVGDGHFAVRLEVFGRLEWHWLGLLAVGSMLATSITLSSGGSGGVFTPSLYVGAATGGSFGVLLSQLFPGLELSPEAYALVGMGAVTAAATGAPITAILLVFEMTNDYGIMLPLMLSTVIAWLVARQFARDNLYTGWLRRRGEHIEQGADRDLMDTLRVGEVFDPAPPAIPEGMAVSRLLQRLAHGEASDLPVIDSDGRVVGVVTVAQLGRIAKSHTEATDLLVAADIAIPAEVIGPTDSVREAVRRMGVRGTGVLPVVDPGTGRLLGVVTRAHVLGAYERAAAGRPA